MTSFSTRMPTGFAGQITRDPEQAIVEAEMMGGTAPTAFGVPVKTVSGALSPIAIGDLAAVVTGVLIYSYPKQSITNSGTPVPEVNTLSNRLRKGYLLVRCAYGSPTLDSPVYMRSTVIGSTRGAGTAGDLEALSDTGVANANVVLPGYRWMGNSISAGGLEEIAVNM